MKRIFPVALIITSALLSTSALAQGYDSSAKGNDSQQMMNETRSSTYESTTQQPAQTAYSSTETTSYSKSTTGAYDAYTGPYVGGDIGYSFANHDVHDPSGPDGEADLDGVEGGAFAGFGFAPNFLDYLPYIGVELAYEWAGADDNVGGNSFEKDHSWVATVRPGLLMPNKALAYGIIGYNRAKFESNATDTHANGLVLGGGVEMDTSMPVKVRLEYAYTNYREEHFNGVDFEGHENNIKAGVLYRF